MADLAKARWIYWPGYSVTFNTPCFHNPCPKGQFTFYFQTTCSFTIYLVDSNGNIVQTVGSGSGWTSYIFKFYTGCGKYSLRIVLKCKCKCPYTKYNLYQDRKNCFNCPDDLRHTYNPNTCSCECASTCGTCTKPQAWTGFPSCTCACQTSLVCKEGYWPNKRTCKCDCLPKCCPKFQYWDTSSCSCKYQIVPYANLDAVATKIGN